MKCPVCQVPLTMSERQGVEIDYCPQCRGVWLDRGELDKIIERSQSLEEPQGRRPVRSVDAEKNQRNDYQYHKRRKNFLGEIFDFD